MIKSSLAGQTIFLIVGESGSGKTSICNELDKQIGAKQLRSYTTRPRRNSAEDNHFFVDDFSTWMINNSKEVIVARTYFDGNHYWATLNQVNNVNTYVIDPAGIEFFVRRYTGNKNIRIIYIKTAPFRRYWRMRKRGDSVFKAIKRLWHDRSLFNEVKTQANLIVSNNNFRDCYTQIKDYMLREDRLIEKTNYFA